MEQFDQLLTCAICLDRYRNPKLLPCQHSFCMEPCMEGLVNYVTRQVKCPECRAEHRIPYQGIQQLPTNVTLQRFLELHIEITGELPDPTSGQVMERCGVCSEKSYCTPCSHCDKRVCSDCKEAHLDILRREICRINNQVRRTLHRLQDALSVIEKNSIHLQQNCANVLEEIDDIYRRLSKALKERTDYLKSEIEVFLAKEQRNLTSLKENLEHEISNFDSNSEFAEKHMGEGSIWDDNELMDAKDIFLKTMEFIRNFECEPGEYHRRVRFAMSQDPNQLAATLSGMGELTINATPQIGLPQSLPTPSLGPGLMRSKSDHRVAAQFRQAEERYMAYGSDNNDGRTSPVGNRRYFGDRLTTRDRYGSTTENTRRNEYDYDSPLDLPSSESSRRSRFRSRFMRHLDSGDSDNEPSNRSVRFHEQSADSGNVAAPPKKERERVLDTEDATRGPLSGITRLQDSPRVIKRIQEMECKDKKKDNKPLAPPTSLPGLNTVPTSQPVTARRTAAARQVSEEDEISKIKKQNKGQDSSATAETLPTRKTSAQSESHPGTPTSTERPKLTSAAAEKTPLSRQTSASSEKKESATPTAEVEDPSKTNQRKRSGYLRQQSDSNRTENQRSAASASSQIAEETSRSSQNATSKPSFSRTSSSSSVNQDESEKTTNGKPSRIGRLSADHFKNRSTSSESSTSAESSTHSSPVRNTGAAFTTEELKNRYIRRHSNSSPTNQNSESAASSSVTATTTPSPATTTPAAPTTSTTTPTRSRFGTVTQPSPSSVSSRFGTTGTNSSTSNSTSSNSTPHRFQSRFLGRAGTPTAEVSRESENSSSSSDDSSESESDSDQAATPSAKDKELARTDIGPLLARSAHARDTSTSYNRNDTPSYSSKTDPSPYSRNRSSVPSITSPPSSARPTPSSSRYGSDSASGTTSSRYGTTSDYSTPTSSAIARSRTGSALHTDDLENKYPLTSKYLNRSRANMPDPSPTSETSSYTPRYGGYRSRFLNKSKSSAALAPDREDDDDHVDDEQNVEQQNHSTDQGWSNHTTSSSLKSGEERYPSGRSRYAALKDRRSRLARSKSSHEVPVADENLNSGGYQGEVEDTGTSSSVDPESGSGSSLSSWARYLKKKYGPRNRDAEGTEPSSGKQSVIRTRSLGQTANGNRPWSPENGVNDETNPASSTIAPPPGFGNLPRNQYMQKRKVLMKFGSRGSDAGFFTWPRGVAVGPDNSIVVADSSNHRVQVFDVNGRFVKEFGYYGNGEGEFDCLAGVAINRIGQYIIADRYNHRIQVFDPAGRFLRVFGSQGSTDGKFSYPWGVTTDALGFIYVCDKENHRVQVFQSDGTFVGKFGSLGNRPGQLEHPHYIAVSCTNRVIVSDSNNHRIQVFDVNGKVLTTFGSEGADEGQFKFPRGVAVDDQGYIIVADSGNNRIQIFNPEGIFIRAFGCWGSGDGEFKGLEGIAVLSNGNIVVCDRENHRIQIF